MPRPKDERPRVRGPYENKRKGLWQVSILNPRAKPPERTRRDLYFGDREEADRFITDARAEIDAAETKPTTVGDALTAYKKYLHDKGNKPITCDETTRRLALFFADDDLLLSRVTEDSAKASYRRVADGGYWVGPADKRRWKPYAVAFHRNLLAQVKTFARWCVSEKLIPSSPVEGVKGVGVRHAGKEQLTGDEARKFYEWCAYKANHGDEAALALLMLLLMALRQGDVRWRVVRDVDLGGTVLRVFKSKTRKGDRPRRIPASLQGMVRKLVEGRSPLEPLFKAEDGGFRSGSWLRKAAARFCKDAEVPYVCPHGLKGTAGTLAADSGALADQVAEYLSHESSSTSEQHYVARGALTEAAAARGLAVIEGGKR
jgi:integrase